MNPKAEAGPDLLDGLNEAQRQAVLHRGSPLLILAGAGSGKTRVITVKIAHLIRQGVDPRSILAVTFTNKAAGEMRERAAGLESAAADVMIRTFHSFGAWLLRRNATVAGLSPSFTIYDDDDVLSLLGSLYPQQNRQLLGHYARQISRAKDFALDPGDDLRPVMEKPDLPEVYGRYEARLREIGNVDFGDLILRTLRLLQDNPEIRSRIHSRFRVILVDEYQDSNITQYHLLKELTGPDSYICVVGDDDQSIYRFRGADVKNIVTFPERFAGTTVVRLEQNYRSTNPILRLAGAVVEHNEHRLGKEMWTTRQEGALPVLRLYPDQDMETADLVRRMAKQPLEGTAVLYRTNAQSRAWETALLHAGIPYRLVGTLRFYEREEVKDTLALVRLVANGKDEVAFRRIINKPARGLGAASVQLLLDRLPEAGNDLLEACRIGLPTLAKKAAAGLTTFLELVGRLRAELGDFGAPAEGLPDWPPPDGETGDEAAASAAPDSGGSNLGGFIESALEASGLRQFYADEDQVAGTQRLANLEELANAASQFPASAAGLVEFLEIIELDSGRESDDHSEERITLITMHNTKGLEFDRVYLTGLEDGIFPRDGESGEELEEERRLFYVALTRARDELTLTCCRQRRHHGRTMELPPSRFLREIPDGLIEVEDSGYSTWGQGSPYGARRWGATPGSAPAKSPLRDATGPKAEYPRGTRVYHDDYGSGEVVKSTFNGEYEVVIVRFETGRSAQFIPKYTSLERIST
jgi:DNA helicase-2/ATP-dependent DNA helicase PcrA